MHFLIDMLIYLFFKSWLSLIMSNKSLLLKPNLTNNLDS